MAHLAPMQATALDGVRRAAERRDAAEARYREAEVEYQHAIRYAVTKRVPMRTVAESAGVSASRVHQIVHAG